MVKSPRSAHKEADRPYCAIASRTAAGQDGRKAAVALPLGLDDAEFEADFLEERGDDLDAGAVIADVVGCPQGTEGVAASGKLADEVGKGAVVGARPASVRRRATVCWAASAQSR